MRIKSHGKAPGSLDIVIQFKQIYYVRKQDENNQPDP